MSDVTATEPTIDDVNPDAGDAELGADDGDQSDDPDDAEYKREMAKIRGDEKARKEAKAVQDAEAEAELEDDEEGEKKPEKKKEEKKPKTKTYKVNGRDVEVDVSDEGKTDRLIQKGLAADEKFSRASDIERNATRFIENLVKDPFSVLANPKLGLSKEQIRDAAERYLYNEYQYEKMSPEERKRLADDEELRKFRSSQEDEQKKAKQKASEEMKEKYRQDWSQKFQQALQGANVPITEWTVARTAMYMRHALKKGRKDVTPADVAPLVKEDFVAEQRKFYSTLSDEDLVETVGKDTADRIRRAELAKFKDGQTRQQPARQQQGAAPAPARRPQQTFSSAEEMRDHLTKRRR